MAKGVKGWKKYLALLLAVALLAPVTAWANYAPPLPAPVPGGLPGVRGNRESQLRG